MKKLIFVLFSLFFTSLVSAHMAHYNNYEKLEMDILRNGEIIGYNHYFFNKKKDETIVTNQIKFSVKLLGATIFQIEGYGEEKYQNDQLISYNSKTLQNDKEKFVNLVFDKNSNNFSIKGSSFTGEASINNIIRCVISHRDLIYVTWQYSCCNHNSHCHPDFNVNDHHRYG